MLAELVGRAVQMVGIEGASAGVLALLFAVALYSHKAATTGQQVAHAGSTVTHDMKVVALVLAGLLVLGVISMDVQRAQEVGRRLTAFDWDKWFQRIWDWIM
ncbi:hypothetical protein [Halorussus marinus]|uniref:hypothetical protein n=1 Tax=Halorussus marinus TaxID=2505976 RepID=UPI00106EB6B8|nr:hypothetical protein [Halorussus marinus]